ncbi:dynein regulatory complex protein 9 isoform X2 [Onychomys torridus]|uniref:dynein regulatory complex protein 9 isoform X2 n=1 Tax=Onychomys torridus TaxID=38674 RepID=UPI00167F7853|nr:dynein regulatory complex protein 9 isoform X2 [Onychomys torridus]
MEGDQLEALDFPSEALHSEVTVVVTGEPPGAIEEEPENEEEGEATSEVIDVLSLLDVLRVSAVMEDIIDQLSILSYIIPVQYERKQSISQKSSHEGTSMVSSTRKTSLTKERPTVSETKQRGLDFILKKPTRQTMMTLETLKKIQNDREEKGRREIKSLQRQLVDVKKERQMQVQNGNEYIAHLKDQLQEMKAKTNLENLYMKRNTELQISQTQKKCNRAEELLLEEIEKLRMRTEEENRVHTDIEMFLKKEQQKLEEKLEFWMEKFDKDTEAKQNELNALKAAKATDLSHLQDLAKTIREYEQVIIEDRMEKEKTRKKMEQDDLELKSIVKLQAWWRGTVVRKEIGGFRMPKKEKDDGKDSKGKEKDKRRGKK